MGYQVDVFIYHNWLQRNKGTDIHIFKIPLTLNMEYIFSFGSACCGKHNTQYTITKKKQINNEERSVLAPDSFFPERYTDYNV